MKVLVLNGSPRLKGNTKIALEQIASGIKSSGKDCEIDFIDVVKYKLNGCINCDSCKRNGGNCVLPGDTVQLIDKIGEADFIVFGSPIYWWGITAQLKMLLDKFYSRVEKFQSMKKNFGLVAIGGAGITDPEYRIIKEQFECIGDYLGWHMSFYMPICASGAGEVSANLATMDELSKIGQNI